MSRGGGGGGGYDDDVKLLKNANELTKLKSPSSFTRNDVSSTEYARVCPKNFKPEQRVRDLFVKN